MGSNSGSSGTFVFFFFFSFFLPFFVLFVLFCKWRVYIVIGKVSVQSGNCNGYKVALCFICVVQKSYFVLDPALASIFVWDKI